METNEGADAQARDRPANAIDIRSRVVLDTKNVTARIRGCKCKARRRVQVSFLFGVPASLFLPPGPFALYIPFKPSGHGSSFCSSCSM
jgi:hypothetical protein